MSYYKNVRNAARQVRPAKTREDNIKMMRMASQSMEFPRRRTQRFHWVVYYGLLIALVVLTLRLL